MDPPDGRLPALTPLAQARADAEVSHFLIGGPPIASWEDLPLPVRCITRGLPGTMSPGFGYNHNYQIFQTPTYVAILSELIHDVRIIPLDGRPHVGAGIRQWLGDSRGRWEEGTLVVETTNFTDKANTRGPTVFGGSGDLRLVERFTRVDANTIDYGYTFEDPTTFTARGRRRFRCARSRGRSSSTRVTRGTTRFRVCSLVAGRSRSWRPNRAGHGRRGRGRGRRKGGVLLASVSVGLGDNDQAISWLQQAAEARDGLMTYLKTYFFFDPLRSDPRFQALLRKMNFPATPAE